jgi:hypothetical protein
MGSNAGAVGRREVLRWVAAVGSAPAAATLAALGGCAAGGPDPTKAQVRFVNATGGYAALDLLVDDKRLFASVGYGASASYGEVDPANADSKITRPGSSTALLTRTLTVKKEKYYAFIAFGGEGSLQSELLDENAGAPDSGKALFRVFNAAPDAGAVDVYLTAPGESLAAAVAVHPDVGVGKSTGYATADAGDDNVWRLRITAAGDRNDLRLDLSGLTLPSRGVTTLVVTPTTGGVLVHALLMRQEDEIRRLDGTLARVRAAAPNAGTVSVSVGGVPLLSAIGAPVVGAYELVPTGRQPVVVTVDGVAVDVPDVTLAPGTDQTLVVYRQNGVPGAAWVVDDNRLPNADGQAKVRLVHGLDTFGGGPLALKVNYLPVGSEVALPGATAYGQVDAGIDNRVSVTASGDPVPLYEAADVILVGDGVYSVFAIEGAAPDAGFVRRDR